MPPPSAPVALVTAASKGIGAAVADALAARGYRLALLARSDALDAVAARTGAVAAKGDVTDPAALDALADAALAAYGRVDAVVVNAGHAAKGDLLALADADFHAGLDLLLLPTVRLARRLVPVMRAQGGGGAFVNVTSFAAAEPDGAYPVSSVVRAGLAAYTKLFADRHAAEGIRMNDVLPGFIDSQPFDDAKRARVPAGRAGTVAELAAVVAFLVSPEAAYVTGQHVRVDGGLTRSL